MPIIKDPEIIERNAVRFFGCGHAEAVALNDGEPLRTPASKAMRFESHKRTAKRRGIGFELTFRQWVNIWEQSGHWPLRGVGKSGFCMARHGDEGPYAAGNVSIVPIVKNSFDGLSKTRASGALRRRADVLHGRGWTFRPGHASPYQVVVRDRYVGVFKTEGEARSAFLRAASDLGLVVSHANRL